MMNKKFSKTEMKGLPGGPNEQFTYVTGIFLQDMYHLPKAQNGNGKNNIISNIGPVRTGFSNYHDVVDKERQEAIDYISSDGYLKLLSKNYKDPIKEQQIRLNRLKSVPVNFKDAIGTQRGFSYGMYYPDSHNIELEHSGYKGIPLEEFNHSSVFGRMSSREKQGIKNAINSSYEYHKDPIEVQNRLMLLKKGMKEAGLYDYNKEDFTKDHLLKLKESIKNNPEKYNYQQINSLIQNVKSDNDLIWLINNVAYNDTRELPIAQKGLEKYQGDGRSEYNTGYFNEKNTFIPDYALPEITVTPETVEKFNLAEKQKRKNEYRTNYQAILDKYNAEDLSGSSGYIKIAKAVENDLIKAGYTKEEATEKRKAILKDMKLNESYKNKNLIYNTEEDEFYKDLTNQELGFVLNYYDPNKMEEQLKDFEATEILGGDFVSYDGSRLSRPASEYRNLDWKSDWEKQNTLSESEKLKEFKSVYPTEKENVYRIGKGNATRFNVKTQFYYGIENGKLKAGTLDNFNDKTVVTPISIQGSKILTKDNVYDFMHHDVFRERSQEEKDNAWLSKHLFYSPTTGKSAFLSGQKNANKFVEENTDAIPIPLDHGRWGIRFEAEDGDVMYGADYKDYMSGRDLTGYRGDLDKGVGSISSGLDYGDTQDILEYEGYNMYIKPPKLQYPDLPEPKRSSIYKKQGGALEKYQGNEKSETLVPKEKLDRYLRNTQAKLIDDSGVPLYKAYNDALPTPTVRAYNVPTTAEKFGMIGSTLKDKGIEAAKTIKDVSPIGAGERIYKDPTGYLNSAGQFISDMATLNKAPDLSNWMKMLDVALVAPFVGLGAKATNLGVNALKKVPTKNIRNTLFPAILGSSAGASFLPLGNAFLEDPYKNAINRKLGYPLFPTYRTKDPSIKKDDITIDLNKNDLTFGQLQDSPTGRILLGGDFVGDAENTVRYAKDWMNASDDDTYGDDNLKTKNIVNYYGIEDGKFKVGKANDFKKDTKIVPNRYDKGQTLDYAGIASDNNGLRLFGSDGNPIYHNTVKGGKIILYSKDSGNSIFMSHSGDKKAVDEINNFVKKNKNVIPVVIDNGRFSDYMINEEGLTNQNYNNYYSSDFHRGKNAGYNIIVKQQGGEGYREGAPNYNASSKLIPSGNITMTEKDGGPLKKGPLLGIDNLGNEQMMYPGYNYQFPGNMVMEIPIAQEGNGEKKAQYLNSEVFDDLKKQSKKSTGVIEQAEEVSLPNRILNAMAQPMTYRANKNQGINSPYVIGLNPFDIALAYVNPTVAFKTGKNAIEETAKGNYGNALLNAAYTASYLPYLKALPLKQKGGTSWTDYLNPFNWGAKNMDKVGDFQTAFRTARGAGYDDFMWQGKRYSTELAEQPDYENLFYDKSLLDNLSDKQKQRREALLYNADLIAKSQGDNEDLRRLLIMTAAMENSLGANPKAYGRDYTRGPMSIDNIAWRDVFDVREGANNYTAQQKKNEKWLNSLGLDINNLETLLRSDDPLASMAVARLVYGRIPEALPSGDDPKAMFDYYLNYYNRKGLLKHGTAEQHYARFLKDYNRIYGKTGGEFQRLVDKYTTKGWNSLTDTEKQEYKNYYNNM